MNGRIRDDRFDQPGQKRSSSPMRSPLRQSSPSLLTPMTRQSSPMAGKQLAFSSSVGLTSSASLPALYTSGARVYIGGGSPVGSPAKLSPLRPSTTLGLGGSAPVVRSGVEERAGLNAIRREVSIWWRSRIGHLCPLCLMPSHLVEVPPLLR